MLNVPASHKKNSFQIMPKAILLQKLPSNEFQQLDLRQ